MEMKTIFRILCLFFGALLLGSALAPTVMAYSIVGNSVIQEDAYSKLQVTPAIASNPMGKNYEQTFVLTNKDSSPQNVYVAYKFDKPLQAGLVNYYAPEVKDWVETETRTCAPPNAYTYTVNIYPIPNPNTIHCYKTNDNNTSGNPADDFNVTIFDTNFSTGDLATHTVNIKHYAKVSGDTWNDVTNLFSTTEYLNDTLYYLANPIAFSANQSLTWKLKYTPNVADTSKKWEMVFYTGANASCILNGTCTYVQWLDPWWDSSWTKKIKITINSPDTNSNYVALIDINSTLLGASTTSFWANTINDGNDVRFVNGAENALLAQNLISWNDNTSAQFAVKFPTLSAGNNDFYLYYGNPTATSNNDLTIGATLRDGFEDNDITNSPLWSATSGSSATSTASKYFGTYGVAVGAGAGLKTVPVAPMVATEFHAWMQSNSLSTSGNHGGLILSSTNTDPWSQYKVYFEMVNDGGTPKLRGRVIDSTHHYTGTYLSPTAGVWYNTKVNINYATDSVTFTVYDTTGAQVWTDSVASLFLGNSIARVQIGGDNAMYFDDVSFMDTPKLGMSFGAETLNNATPDINMVYPNTAGLLVSGTKNIQLNFADADFNASGTYKLGIKIRRPDTNASTIIMNDGNAFAYCTNMDSNATVKACSVSYNFSLNLASSVVYVVDVNVTDDKSAVGTKTSPDFNVLKVVLFNEKMVRTNLNNLSADGVNFGVSSEGWSASESTSKTMNAPNVNRKQYLIVRKLRDNSALALYVNSVSVGTIVADSADPQIWQLYAFPVAGNLLHGNPQTILLTAPGAQATTYVDWVALADSVDTNIYSGGEALTYIWDVNFNGIANTSNQFVLDQNGVLSYTDANSTAMADGNYVSVVYPTTSLDKNVFGFIKVVAGGATYLSDTNKTAIVDSTNPVINSISMTYFDVIAGRRYHFDSNSSDTYWTNGILSIEGVDYDLNSQALGGNDHNAYGDFNFTSGGNFSLILSVFDQVDRNISYPFTVRSSAISLTSSTESNDSNWLRANAVAILSSASYTSISFRKDFNFTAVGTANITYFDHNYNLNNGTNATTLGGVINVKHHRANKVLQTLSSNTTQNNLIASDLNGNVSLEDYITYDVNGAITTQWKNTGIEDKRLIWVSPRDLNSTLTGFWVKVASRTPYNSNTYKVLFKECTDTPDFSAGTCVSYTTIDIYSETDANYNGDVYPTVDSDSDGLKDTIYFKVPTLGDHMYLIDLTGVQEPTWSAGSYTNTGQQGGTSPKKPSVPSMLDENSFLGQTATGFFTGFDGFAGVLGSMIGGIVDFVNLQFTRLNVQGVFQGENLFTIISIFVLVVIVFFFLPKAQAKTTKKSFGASI